MADFCMTRRGALLATTAILALGHGRAAELQKVSFTLPFLPEAPCRLAFAVFVAFFPVPIATVVGLGATDLGALAPCRWLGAARWQTMVLVRLPFAVPHLVAGLKTAATLALLGIVIGSS